MRISDWSSDVCSSDLAPHLQERASIILVGSLASDKVLDGHAVYAGTKAAIGAFARSWALEFKDRGIRANMLSPGPTETEILGKLGVAPEERGDRKSTRLNSSH